MSEEKYGIVYALVNEAMPGLVKIGITGRNDLKDRVDELSRPTGVPARFQVACACQVAFDRKEQVERALHLAFAPYRLSANREFFKISPDQVRALFDVLDEGEKTDETTRELAGQVDKGMNDGDRVAIEKLKSRRPPLNFAEMGIPAGSVLIYTGDESVTVTVVGDKKVLYQESEQSLTAATQTILQREYAVQPTRFWTFNGRNLHDIYEETYPLVDM